MAFISIFQIVCVLTFCLYLVGLLNNLFSDTDNACEMTYMYEYPQFVRVKVPGNEKFIQYGLYAYSEGRFTERARKMRFDGVPVLFLPGNVGSHKQVRSLASVALRKAIPSSKHSFHFDYFTVDFNEEKSGLFGGVLENQLAFSTNCIQAILNLYQSQPRNGPAKPASIIIIGHSMGGVIARALMADLKNRNVIHLILTLASPHERPVLNADHYFHSFYSKIDQHWSFKTANTSNIQAISKIWDNKVFISIGGGMRDILVPSSVISSPHSDISALTTSIPGVWLSTDHLCIVWCKQLVLVLNRFLFSVIDPSTRQLTGDTAHIVSMGKHFLKAGHVRNASHYDLPADFIPDANWHEDVRRIYSVKHERGISKTWYYMIRLIDLPDHEHATVESIDLDEPHWLFGCQAKYIHGQNRVCMSGRHLSQFSEWEPSKAGRRRLATLDLKALRASYPHWTHVIIRAPPTNKKVQINIDVHSLASRQLTASLPFTFNPLPQSIVSMTQPGALTYNITLPALGLLFKAYLLYVEPHEGCSGRAHHATAKMIIPWAEGHEVYDHFTDVEKAPMKIRLTKGSPATSNKTADVTIMLTLDPQCTYAVSISAPGYDTLGQLSRHYSTSLPSYLCGIVLLALRHMAASMEAQQQVPSFHSALCSQHVKPYYILLYTKITASVFLGIPYLKKMSGEWLLGPNADQSFLALPLLLYMISLGLANILGAVCWGLLISSGQIAHKVLLRLLSMGRKGSVGGARFYEWAAGVLRKAPGAAGVLLVGMATASCGATALTAGAAFYFFMLTKMYEDYLEDFVYKAIAKVARKFKMGKPRRKSKDGDKKEDASPQNAEEQKEESESVNEGEELKSEALKEIEESKSGDVIEGSKTEALKDKEESENAGEGDEKALVLSDTEKTDKKRKKRKNSGGKKSPKALKDSSNVVAVRSSEDVVEDREDDGGSAGRRSRRDSDFSLKPLNFHFIMFFVWCLVTILNIPTLLTWAHNFKYNKILEHDPSYIPGLIMCCCATVLWQLDEPRSHIKYYGVVDKIMNYAAMLTIATTPLAPYRLNYILSGAFALITLHQTFYSTAETADNGDDQNPGSSGQKKILGCEEEEANANEDENIDDEMTDVERIQLMKEKMDSEEIH